MRLPSHTRECHVYGIEQTGIGLLILAAAVVLIVVVAASYFPARRATRIEPSSAIRYV